MGDRFRRTCRTAAALALGVLAVSGCTHLHPSTEPGAPTRRDEPYPAEAAAPARLDDDAIPPAGEAAEPGAALDGPPAGVARSPEPAPTAVWGLVNLRGYAQGQQVAPNGFEFTPIFLADFHFNFWLWRSQGLYGFTDTNFWGQKAAPGITNPTQGAFDFSKREFDLSAGLAWNYAGRWEARAFAYSFNNLNRGFSPTAPRGFADGVGLENRYYLTDNYDQLGTAEFDLARATFISVGYYPTKEMVDGEGRAFKPGAFVRAYLTQDLWEDRCYLYADSTLLAARAVTPKLLTLDAGIAFRPFPKAQRWEFRLGSADLFDLKNHGVDTSLYGAIRLVF